MASNSSERYELSTGSEVTITDNSVIVNRRLRSKEVPLTDEIRVTTSRASKPVLWFSYFLSIAIFVLSFGFTTSMSTHAPTVFATSLAIGFASFFALIRLYRMGRSMLGLGESRIVVSLGEQSASAWAEETESEEVVTAIRSRVD